MRRKRDYVIVFLMGVMGLSLVIGTTVFITGCGKVSVESMTEEKVSIEDTTEQEIRYIPQEPPWLDVTYDGGDSITVYTGSAEWAVHNADGTSNGGIYCGVHPLEMKYDDATLIFDASHKLHELTLDFEVKPDSWEVMTFWPAEYMGNSEEYDNGMEYSTTAEIEADNVMLGRGDGSYIYEIFAVWDREEYSGYASYCFQTVIPEEALDSIGTQ